ncbi:MAG TPA: S8 family serine peptidase, partial [Bdellovibrionales bacterium]|nr:S8 family serine peptidase [Bdellovibrionales bacterium]
MIQARSIPSIVLAFFALACGSLHAQNGNYVPGEVIVKIRSSEGSPEAYNFLGKAHSNKSMTLKDGWGRMDMYHFALKKGQTVESAVHELMQDPEVLYAEPNYYLGKSDSTGMHEVFSAAEIQAAAVSAQAVNYLATSVPIGVQSVWSQSMVPAVKPIVAVIDTGLDVSHFVIRQTGALWTNNNEIPNNGVDDDMNGYVDDVNGWNFVNNSGLMYDDDGHGTHVSGIILSIDQNIYVTPLREAKIEIMPLKFLNGNGVGTTSDAIRAIYYAANNGATVLNNSWGGSAYSAALHEAIAYTYTKGALFVAAAGNAGTNNDSAPLYPANYDVPNVISIAATTDRDWLASFSNFGASSVDMGSPGTIILSTIPNGGFGTSSGTSMAAPFVAGTAAQMKVEAPGILGYQMREILLGTIAGVSELSGKVASSGRLNTSASVAYSKTAAIRTTQPGYSLSYSADRELASSMAGGGGCGTVRALSQGEPPFGSGGTVVLLLLTPIVALVIMRLRSPASRRKHERFKINSDVRITVGDRELVGSVSSISLGGAQINTAALLQDGGLVTMSISSPSGEEKIEVAGRVVWSEANKAYGVA